jgi:predicted phosphohydrolase
MIIQYASDLHLEFPDNREFLRINPIKPTGEVLLLAGDIVPFVVMDKYNDFFNYISDNFETTFWIPGNHEYYKSDISNRSGVLNEKIKNNIFLVNNFSIIHKDVKFIFSTLWSKISVANQWIIGQLLNDFHLIKHKEARFTTTLFNQFHEQNLEFLKQELRSDKILKTAVVTHHCPTFFNYPEKYRNSEINEAFAVELFDLIETTAPDYWIYGHIHFNTPDFVIGKTQLVTNQLGYVNEGEHQQFKNGCIFEI